MEKQIYNDQKIIQYLLGDLSEEETEQFDELSFINEEFSERLDVVETGLVDAYVKGELSGQTLDRFASYYLSSPRRREKVGFAQALQTVAERAVAMGQVEFEPEPLSAAAPPDKPVSIWKSLLGFFTLPRLAVAAVVILALLGGWSAFELSRLRNQVERTQARYDALDRREKELREKLQQQQSANSALEEDLKRVREEKDQLERQMAPDKQIAKSQPPALPAPFVLPAAKRGEVRATEISIPPGTNHVPFRLEIEPDDYRSYRVELLTESGEKPAGWKRDNLRKRKVNESQVIDVKIPARLLTPQSYILQVTGISRSGAPGVDDKREYRFRIVKE